MKNLATCKPSEFIAQTAKIREAVADWMEVIEFLKIREEKPVYRFLPKDATPEQAEEINRANAQIKEDMFLKKINTLLDNMLAKHPRETLNILALCCFVEPTEVDNYSMDEYFGCIMDMFENKTVLRFFSLLAQLDQKSTSEASKA